MKTYVGIDPGTQGGIAIVSANSAYAYAMPETERDTLSIFEEISNFDTVFALIEDVHSMPGNSARSMFTFGRNYGMLRAMLIANYIHFETVTPTTWQKEFRDTKHRDGHENSPCESCEFINRTILHRISVRTFL